MYKKIIIWNISCLYKFTDNYNFYKITQGIDVNNIKYFCKHRNWRNIYIYLTK